MGGALYGGDLDQLTCFGHWDADNSDCVLVWSRDPNIHPDVSLDSCALVGCYGRGLLQVATVPSAWAVERDVPRRPEPILSPGSRLGNVNSV